MTKRPWLWVFAATALGELLGLQADTMEKAMCMGILLLVLCILLRLGGRRYGLPCLLFVCLLTGGMLRGDFALRPDSRFLYLESLCAAEGEVSYPVRIARSRYQGDKWHIEGDGIYAVLDRDLWEDRDKSAFLRGARLRLYGNCKRIRAASNPGCFDARSYYAVKGITHVMSVQKIELLEASADLPAFWKERGVERMLSAAGEKEGGFAAALLLGDRRCLDEDLYTLFQESGISHILAISGLHVSLIGMSVYGLLRRCRLGYAACGLISGLFLLFYAHFIGDGAGVYRAVAMLILAFTAAYRGRSYDLLSALSFTGTLLCLWNPFVLYQAAFILSFGAVLSIGLGTEYLVKPIVLLLYGGGRGVKTSFGKAYLGQLIVALGIQIFTLPLIAWHFFYIPLYALVLNLLILPSMGLLCLSSLALLLPKLPFLQQMAWANIRLLLILYEKACRISLGLPGSRILLGRPAPLQCILYYLLLGAGLYVCRRKIDALRYAPPLWRLQRLKKILSIFVLCWITATAILCFREDKGTEFTCLDVGQGDGIYMRVGAKDILIDGGSTSNRNLAENTLEPFLLSKAVNSLDFAVVTHADADHYNAVLALTESASIRVEKLFLPYMAAEDEKYAPLIKGFGDKGTEIIYMQAGDIINCEKGSFICLSPREGQEKGNTNEQSIVLLYEEGDFHILLTGDAGTETEKVFLQRMQLPEVDILKVGHHGSFTSTSEELLYEIRPEYAILSYGEKNRYGHPSREVLYRLQKYEVRVYRTAEEGAISFYWKNQKLRKECFKEDENNKQRH